jgi:hypothetical protein
MISYAEFNKDVNHQRDAANARWAKYREERARLAMLKALPSSLPNDAEEIRKARIQTEIDNTLDRIAACNDDGIRIKLTNALDKLWNLVYAKAGVRKPGKSQDRRAGPTAPIG